MNDAIRENNEVPDSYRGCLLRIIVYLTLSIRFKLTGLRSRQIASAPVLRLGSSQ